MNPHAQALGKLGGLANKGKPKSEAHKAALRKVLEGSRKRSTLTQDASKDSGYTIFKVSIPEPKRCQHAYCTNQGREVLVQGLKAWLCEAHG